MYILTNLYEYIDSWFLFLLLAIVIFLICREIFCWYYKVNRIVELLESIEKKLVNREVYVHESNISK